MKFGFFARPYVLLSCSHAVTLASSCATLIFLPSINIIFAQFQALSFNYPWVQSLRVRGGTPQRSCKQCSGIHGWRRPGRLQRSRPPKNSQVNRSSPARLKFMTWSWMWPLQAGCPFVHANATYLKVWYVIICRVSLISIFWTLVPPLLFVYKIYITTRPLETSIQGCQSPKQPKSDWWEVFMPLHA